MALVCPDCGRQYDVTLFEYGRRVVCECGRIITLRDGHTIYRRRRTPPLRPKDLSDEAKDTNP
jgi:DNA-directed RNA polymerase subunit RPC12/RpoP